MRLAAAFVAHELRTQARSLRFRVLAAAYVIAGSAPAALAGSLRRDSGTPPGAATCTGEVMGLLPLLTAVLAFLLSLDAISRERDQGAWSTVALAGISSSGYLLRRWLALQVVLLPLSLLPHLAAGIVGFDGVGALAFGPVLYPWLMVTAPLTLAFSGLGLGLGTIAGSAGNALLLGAIVLFLGSSLADAALGRLGIRLSPALDGLNVRGVNSLISRLQLALNPKNPWHGAFPRDVSDAPYDAGVAAEQYLTRAALPLALAALCLGAAVLFLRRSRPDVRPWRIPAEHPLRTFLAVLSRLRDRARPDPRPARADLLVLAVALLVAAGLAAVPLGRARSYDTLARARYTAEREGGPDPTPTDLLPGRWRLEGRIGPGRAVDLTVSAEMRNLGTAPQSHLACELNPYLRVLAVSSSDGRVTATRRWDRLALELLPPIPPGGRRELRFRLAGEPAEVSFHLPYSETGFQGAFGRQLHARFARDLSDLSRAYRRPALSRRRIDLGAADLVPLPRYETWKLGSNLAVPEMAFRPQADLAIALTTDDELFLVDSCGGVAAGGRLASHCRQPLADLAIAGGSYRRITSPGAGVTAAVLPLHAALGERHLGFLARGAERLAEAWPGLGDLRRLVILEQPDESALDVDATQRPLYDYWYEPGTVEVKGNLVRLKESDLIQSRPLDPDSLVAELVAGRLARRRPIAAGDALLFRHLFRDLALERLGKGHPTGAAFGPLRPGEGGMVHIPPPGPREPGHWLYWGQRFPALVAALEARMGAEALRRALDELLTREDPRPATAAELYALLRARSEVPLDRMIQDFFVAGALPSPVLEEVTFHRAADSWRVTGRMRNEGDGEALCKVVLVTDLGPVETLARAGEGEAAAFAFVTRNRPQAVRLDPDRECHRLIPNGAPKDQVYFDRRGG